MTEWFNDGIERESALPVISIIVVEKQRNSGGRAFLEFHRKDRFLRQFQIVDVAVRSFAEGSLHPGFFADMVEGQLDIGRKRTVKRKGFPIQRADVVCLIVLRVTVDRAFYVPRIGKAVKIELKRIKPVRQTNRRIRLTEDIIPDTDGQIKILLRISRIQTG